MTKENKNTESWLNKHLLNIALVVIGFGIILIVLAPYLFTQLSTAYNLTDKGTIGDAIGGTTAPIASLLGSVLVFLSLYAQIQANRLVLAEFKAERERYNREENERVKDKTNQQQDEMFRTLLNLIQNQNQELVNLHYEGTAGLDSVRFLAGLIYSGGDEPHFNLEAISKIVS